MDQFGNQNDVNMGFASTLRSLIDDISVYDGFWDKNTVNMHFNSILCNIENGISFWFEPNELNYQIERNKHNLNLALDLDYRNLVHSMLFKTYHLLFLMNNMQNEPVKKYISTFAIYLNYLK